MNRRLVWPSAGCARAAGVVLGVFGLGAALPLGAQVMLRANGPGQTYELISSALGGNPIEVPDCGHQSFGRHITEAWDDELGKYVFVFHIHVNEDDDRCTNFDRQRNEIKTYGPSPAYVKGFHGNVHTYRWKFKLDAGFRPSPNFTHIFQIKAGDGSDAGAPIITFTPRAGNPERLQIIHTPSSGTGGGGVRASANLSAFKGQWVEAYVRSLYTDTGTIEIVLRRVSDGEVLLSWSSNNIDMWRGNATFNRPKWGIYRSLNSISHLRDEQVRFADFCIAKGDDICPSDVGMLPPPWNSGDVGTTGAVGGASFGDGEFIVWGAGAGIGGGSDAFHFVRQPVDGDVTVTARVREIEPAETGGQAGVMIRESLEAGSRHVMMFMTSSSGGAFRHRAETGGLSSGTGGVRPGAEWVRIVRSGDLFTGYRSGDGVNWIEVGSVEMAMSWEVFVGLAQVSGTAGTLGSARFTEVHVNTLPDPWAGLDIGEPGAPGSVLHAGGVFTVRAAGADIWGVSDEFHYVHQPVSGDVEIRARVRAMDGSHEWAKAGVMIRERLDADSAHAMVVVTPSSGVAFQRRTTAGGGTSTTGASGEAPWLVRLVRGGDTFTAFHSSSGRGWTEIGSATIAMGTEVYVGLAFTSHVNGMPAAAEFDGVIITAADFALGIEPWERTVTITEETTYTVVVNGVNGFGGMVALSAGELPAGVVAEFSPVALNSSGNSTLTIMASGETPPGEYALTVTGTAGGLVRETVVQLRVPEDSSGDGIPDAWRLRYFGEPRAMAENLSRAEDDADGDGMTNRGHFMTGTDPTDSESNLRVLSAEWEGEEVRLRWWAVGGKSYVVEVAEGLGEGDLFEAVSGVIAVAGEGELEAEFLDEGAGARPDGRWYRVRLFEPGTGG